MKKLPIGIQTFSSLIRNGFQYVDKTRHIFDLISQEQFYFLARPRRFGKSLLISTLSAIFSGEKDLFEKTWIGNTSYAWPIHPIIQLDFSALPHRSPEELTKELKQALIEIADKYGVSFSIEMSLETSFRHLISSLAEAFGPVVILIDEYDHPIISHLNEPKIAQGNRAILKSFFGIIKSQDQFLRFVLLTGVSKFSQVSVFSGLNNLYDITLSPNYSTLLGYTENEIIENFSYYISDLIEKNRINENEIINQMRAWYNGYRFSTSPLTVYNPFSTLMFLKEGLLRSYWFSTGTPEFLIDLIKERSYPIDQLENEMIRELSFSNYDVVSIQVIPLLFQTGYLTIKEYNPELQTYRLGYPNLEVKLSFLMHMASNFAQLDASQTDHYVFQLKAALDEFNLNQFFTILHRFFANIPYTIQISQEKYYQTILFVIAQLIGLNVEAEIATYSGRIDMCIESKKFLYIFEFKLMSSAQSALDQIIQKKYPDKYRGHFKKIVLVGVSFSIQERNILFDWTIHNQD